MRDTRRLTTDHHAISTIAAEQQRQLRELRKVVDARLARFQRPGNNGS
jgi:hypothetical protein